MIEQEEMTMIKKLTPETATITTATVEVRTLTLNGKQVTLSVFRQLRSGSLINYNTGTLNGTPWGTVNYHCDKVQLGTRRVGCEDTWTVGQHLHVVWQDGDELKRDRIHKIPVSGPVGADMIDVMSQSAFCANGHRIPAGFTPSRTTRVRAYNASDHTVISIDGELTFDAFGIKCIGIVEWDKYEAHECTGLIDESEARDAVNTAHRERQSLIESKRIIDALPQLFIAV